MMDLFGVSADYLLGRLDEQPPVEPAAQENFSAATADGGINYVHSRFLFSCKSGIITLKKVLW
jgi:hypothetical protein